MLEFNHLNESTETKRDSDDTESGGVRTRVFVSGGFSLTVLVAGLMGSRGLMVAAVTEPGAARGGVEVLGVGVTRDCWLLSNDCRRAGRLFCEATRQIRVRNTRPRTSPKPLLLETVEQPEYLEERDEVGLRGGLQLSLQPSGELLRLNLCILNTDTH